MNEWSRLTEISTNTRIYLARNEVQKMTHEAAVRMAKIHRTHRRIEAHQAAMAAANSHEVNLMTRPLPPPPPGKRPVTPIADNSPPQSPALSPTAPSKPGYISHPPPSHVYELPAIELPADPMPNFDARNSSDQYRFSSRYSNPNASRPNSRHSLEQQSSRPISYTGSPRRSSEAVIHEQAPPLPPKTPFSQGGRPVHNVGAPMDNAGQNVIISMPSPTQGASRPIATTDSGPNKWRLPYPDDGPPPPVNRSRKPTSHTRA